jgi:hypothetical protein
LHGGFEQQQHFAQAIALALAAFGGRVIAVETKPQATA